MAESRCTTFMRESNRIEGIMREPYLREVQALYDFLNLKTIQVGNVDALVHIFQPDAVLRRRVGMNVRVGNHVPQRGGPGIITALEELLGKINHSELLPYHAHRAYEFLHPFSDGNGRSGRALWAWQMLKEKRWPGLDLGFLHAFYYQTLACGR